jgi:hypothetical protein
LVVGKNASPCAVQNFDDPLCHGNGPVRADPEELPEDLEELDCRKGSSAPLWSQLPGEEEAKHWAVLMTDRPTTGTS